MKMFQSCHWSSHLKLKTSRRINVIMLHPLFLRVEEHNMGRVRGVEKMRSIREIKRIAKMKGVEVIIAETK